jgi:peptidoglycan/LPS O-acetylase OafA/YrhL
MKSYFADLQSRNFGLDILRATAILLVLYSHRSMISTSDSKEAHFIYLCGYWGVELFFVLSGYLIGWQLIKLSENESRLKSYLHFFKRRWARTLPLYFLVLAWYVAYEAVEFPWRHLLFLQNTKGAQLNDLNLFGQSWSLTIEEFAYIILPISFLIGSKLFNFASRNSILIVLMVIIFLSLLARIFYFLSIPEINYDVWIRKSTFLRLDSIAYGILIAWVRIYAFAYFLRLRGVIFPLISLFTIIICNTVGDILVMKSENALFFPSTFGFCLNGILLSMLIPFFDSNDFISSLRKFRFLFWGVTTTAIFSYCLYLIHLPFYKFFYIQFDGKIPFKLNVAMMLTVIYVVSFFSYFLIERPIIKWSKK